MSYCLNNELQWRDRKHYCGLPLGFAVYAVSSDRLFLNSGFLHQASRDILLYRIRDISFTCTLAQRVLGLGTVRVTTMDNEVILLENIRFPHQVKELIYQNVEEQKQSRRIRFGGYHFYAPESAPFFADWL